MASAPRTRCCSPPPCGEGIGVGVGAGGRVSYNNNDPPPHPSPTRGEGAHLVRATCLPINPMDSPLPEAAGEVALGAAVAWRRADLAGGVALDRLARVRRGRDAR